MGLGLSLVLIVLIICVSILFGLYMFLCDENETKMFSNKCDKCISKLENQMKELEK